MSDPIELMQAANYANNNGDPDRAKAIAEGIIRDYPESDAAKAADRLLRSFAGFPSDESAVSLERTKPTPHRSRESELILKDVQIPFDRMIMLLVKIALASIPAVIIVTIIVVFAMTIAGSFLAALVQ